jgi:hypothetical protein
MNRTGNRRIYPWPTDLNAPVAFLTDKTGEHISKIAYDFGQYHGYRYRTTGTTRGVIVERVA